MLNLFFKAYFHQRNTPLIDNKYYLHFELLLNNEIYEPLSFVLTLDDHFGKIGNVRNERNTVYLYLTENQLTVIYTNLGAGKIFIIHCTFQSY